MEVRTIDLFPVKAVPLDHSELYFKLKKLDLKVIYDGYSIS